MASAKKPVPDGYHTITPQLTLDDAARAIDWYKKALGAEELGRSIGPDGKVMHAELKIGNSRIFVNDPVMDNKGPKAHGGGSPASLWLYVDDCDAVFKRAVTAGAQVRMPVDNQFWGDRMGAFVDPHGYSWSVATRKEDLTKEEMDSRAQEFFKAFAKKQPQPLHT
jgi:PhnB protein